MHLYDHPQVHTMFRVRRGAGSMSELVSRNSLNGILQAVAALAHWTVTGAGYLTSQVSTIFSLDRTISLSFALVSQGRRSRSICSVNRPYSISNHRNRKWTGPCLSPA
jgi:hypothetical protein